jgi:tetratricopeptide (TPR) repeat protein
MEKLYAKDSNDINTLWYVGYFNLFAGRYKESLKYFEKWLEGSKTLSEGILLGIHCVGLAYWQNGYKEKAEYYFNEQINYCNRIKELGRVYGPNARVFYDLVSVYAFREEKDKAYENMTIYSQMQSGNLLELVLIKDDPLFNNIRNEP